MKSEGQRQSQRHERRIAKMVGGKTVGGSGNSWSHKGDVDAEDMLIEHKYTGNKSYSINANIWRKIETEAVRSAKIPVYAITLQDLDLWVMDPNDILAMRQELDELRARFNGTDS